MFNFYGFFIALGVLVGTEVVKQLKNKKQKTKAFHWFKSVDVYQSLAWILVPAILFARLYHVWDYWEYYRDNLGAIIKIWQGGLGIFGAIIGGLIGLSIFFKRQIKNIKFKTSFLSFLDLGVVGLAIGQSIGRWGNFFNQELYGWPTNFPWGIYIRLENRLPGLEDFTHFHPLFLYESLGCMVIFIFLLKITRKKTGINFFLYLFLYSLLRFCLEFLRPAGWQIPIYPLKYVRVTHIITFLSMLISLLALVRIFVTMKKEQK